MSPQKREVWCLRPKFSLGSKKDMHLSSTQPLQLLLQLVPAGLAIMKYLSPTSIVFGYVSIEADFRKTCLHHDQSVVFFGCFWQWMLSQRSCGMPWQTVWVRDKVENAIFLYLARSRNHGRNDSFRFSFCAKIPGSTAFYGKTSKCDLGFSVFFRVVIYHFFLLDHFGYQLFNVSFFFETRVRSRRPPTTENQTSIFSQKSTVGFQVVELQSSP